MKKVLLLSLLVLFGCSSEDDEAAAKEVEFNCNPTNFIELYDGLTLKGTTKAGDDIYISFSSDDDEMMTFTNNLSYYISSGYYFKTYNAPPGCSVVSKNNPDLSMYPNAEEREPHEQKLYAINRLEIQEHTLNKLRIIFYAYPPNAGEIAWRMDFQEGNQRTLSPNCPFTLNKVNTFFQFSRNYEFNGSLGRGGSPANPTPTFEVIDQPISDFCG